MPCRLHPSFSLLFPTTLFSTPHWCSYNDVEDEHRATNILITADEDFKDLKVSHMGVSSFSKPCSHAISLASVVSGLDLQLSLLISIMVLALSSSSQVPRTQLS